VVAGSAVVAVHTPSFPSWQVLCFFAGRAYCNVNKFDCDLHKLAHTQGSAG
jgi:hypothetical protein